MYKRALGVLTAVLLLLLGCCGMFGFPEGELEYAQVSLMKLDAACLADGKSSAVGMAAVAASGQRVVGFQVMEKEPQPGYALPEKDYEVLLRIVEAEAGGEDAEGRLLV
ncbi:MAG: hypothetical protein LBQ15_07775, partial [Clostridium sp.]|nr:hypothetical protein [Clostridium sp.]